MNLHFLSPLLSLQPLRRGVCTGALCGTLAALSAPFQIGFAQAPAAKAKAPPAAEPHWPTPTVKPKEPAVKPEASSAPASPVAGPSDAPAPEVPPGVEKAKETPAQREAREANAELEAQAGAGKKTEPDWFPTPEWLKEKLTLGAGMGFGLGSGPVSGAKPDRLGFHLSAVYALEEAAFLAGASYLTELRFAWSNSVDPSSADREYANQFFLAGGGLELEIEEVEGMRVWGTALVGFSRSPAYSFTTSSNVTKALMGFNFGLQARALYRLLPSVDAYVGVGSQMGKVSWTDLQVGLAGTF